MTGTVFIGAEHRDIGRIDSAADERQTWALKHWLKGEHLGACPEPPVGQVDPLYILVRKPAHAPVGRRTRGISK